ncbi:dienelactone hydrolase family protein [Rhodospirillum centenum]|uniref:Carboxymethylenebutenolidase, putative n=1 Tax=Rhodospirillum centenum (strain ATCC 51521 / SW) TaxID=414684 RepID=B6IN29_RHOCS|nr:dienelactone hydrolase family protein [Rhodospirillum centenum]ACI98926.1 carboxymethylenebutenolidase, putative [Rhodospirillum centenum SW]
MHDRPSDALPSPSVSLAPDARGLVPPPAMSRRAFAVTGLAAGFALSVRPVAAATITTPADGLTAGEVRIPVTDGELPAYRAAPRGDGPFPVVLVVQEIFGVHEHIRDVCRRFAREGWLAVAPELYARQGDPAAVPDIQTLVRDLVSKVPDAQVLGDLDATLRWAGANGGDADRAAVTGFCWGGRITWLYAAHQPRLKAGVAWYGRLASPPTGLQPMVPVQLAAELKAPVLGLYGGADQGIPVADVDAMRKALAAAGKTESEIVLYPDGPHGFFADYRASYRPEIAADAWARCLAFLRAHGAG